MKTFKKLHEKKIKLDGIMYKPYNIGRDFVEMGL